MRINAKEATALLWACSWAPTGEVEVSRSVHTGVLEVAHDTKGDRRYVGHGTIMRDGAYHTPKTRWSPAHVARAMGASPAKAKRKAAA